MVNDEAAKQFAGEGFVETFERAVREKGMEEAVRQAQTNVRTYLNQSVMEKAQAMMVNRSDIKSDEKLDEKFFYAFVDSTAPAEKANEIVRRNTLQKVVAFEDNLRESALLRNTADKRAYGLLTEALTDVSGNRIGEALKTRIAESGLKGKDFSEWTGYLLLMHSLDRDAQGKPVFDRYALTAAERRAEIARIEQEHPEFKKAANAFQA
ncbi:MAG: hypothetical protein Q3982_07425, partial [Phoenicibacter congonensis]|nr:hypothetical protein [Phoenicibacter congonensis]